MTTVGAYARIQMKGRDLIRRRLDSLSGVTTFDLDDPDRLGLVIETPDLLTAHGVLCVSIRRMEGVLGVWPVSVQEDPEFSAAASRNKPTRSDPAPSR